MSMLLEAIKFNHDPTSATNDAFNIGENARPSWRVPEWRRGISVNPEDSTAAYAIKETRGNTISIQAKLKRTDPNIQKCYVRAVDPTADAPPLVGCIGLLYRLLLIITGGRFGAVQRSLSGNILGEVKAKQITFPADGETDFTTFQLHHMRLWSAGMGLHTVTWRWQFRLRPSEPWTDFATTTHNIYSLPELPISPWEPPQCPTYRVPDHFNEPSLARELSLRLAGTSADGSAGTVLDNTTSVVWVESGDEVLIHLDSLQNRILDGALLVSVDLETDQTGRSPLIVSFVLSNDPNDPAGLVATTDEYPRGHGQLAARWGRPLQAALWASLLSIAQDHAAERSAAPQAIVVRPGALHLQAGEPLSIIPTDNTSAGYE
jgi:hypothetical protein